MRKSLLLLMVLAFFAVDNASAQLEKHQATFIYNFTRLVQWPELYKEPTFVIGVLGSSEEITSELKAGMGNRTVAGKDIQVVEFRSVSEAANCHLLFVPNGSYTTFARAASALDKLPVLVVTEIQGRQPSGSVINFSIENDRLGIRLDEELAKSKKLLVSSQLANFSR